jgi:hypothetical protein
MLVDASVLAMRSGMMNGTLDDGFASASSVRGNGFLSLEREGLVVDGLHDSVTSAIFCPRASRFDHLSIDAMQSAERTGVPSWNLSPSRSVNVGQLILADLVFVDHLRLHLELGVGREQRVVDHVPVIAGDVRRRGDRIENAQVGLRDELEHLLPLRQRGRSGQHCSHDERADHTRHRKQE